MAFLIQAPFIAIHSTTFFMPTSFKKMNTT
uniref:Uncharacterized protein n=1 Tax=Arundo donax TaxID=35708 RepID=A0A0A9ACR1_ARUDO